MAKMLFIGAADWAHRAVRDGAVGWLENHRQPPDAWFNHDAWPTAAGLSDAETRH
jgi:hypothetical protein